MIPTIPPEAINRIQFPDTREGRAWRRQNARDRRACIRTAKTAAVVIAAAFIFLVAKNCHDPKPLCGDQPRNTQTTNNNTK